MATYKQIQACVKKSAGFTPRTCWIAHAKEINGIPVRKAHNRKDPDKRAHPCPEEKLPAIENAFRHFKMVK